MDADAPGGDESLIAHEYMSQNSCARNMHPGKLAPRDVTANPSLTAWVAVSTPSWLHIPTDKHQVSKRDHSKPSIVQATRCQSPSSFPRRMSTAIQAATLEAPVHQEAEQENGEATIDWARHWYPLAFVEDLDPGRPHAAELLGRRLVLWRDASKQWRAFEDRCPHRLAPLSEGRIEEADGSLMCSYHGWRFQGDGACMRIPQAMDPKAEARACSSGRACAAVFPTQVRQGFLHVWGDSGPSAAADAAKAPLMLVPQLDPNSEQPTLRDGSPTLDSGKRYLRDMPYGWDFLVENLIDPAHVNYSHSGVIGNRNSPTAGHYEISPAVEPAFDGLCPENGGAQDALSYDVVSLGLAHPNFTPQRATYRMDFVAPFLVRYLWSNFGPGGDMAHMWMAAVPTGPGRSRLLWWFFHPSKGAPKKLQQTASVPVWKDHLLRNLVLDGDNVFLHKADRLASHIDQAQGSKWRGSYYMPMQADKMVTAFRQWLDKHGGRGPTPGDPGPVLDDRRALLDRYNQHTRHCAHCLKALARVKALRAAAVGAGAAALLCLAALLGSGAMLAAPGGPARLWCAVLCAFVAGCGALWRHLTSTVEHFYFVGYSHQDH